MKLNGREYVKNAKINGREHKRFYSIFAPQPAAAAAGCGAQDVQRLSSMRGIVGFSNVF